MKSHLERLRPSTDSSWSMLNRRLEDGIPFQWHHHPELELTLTLNSRGERFIGDHIGAYDDGDLVLVDSNLPHTWCSAERIDATQPHVALVLWFRPEWVAALDGAFTELGAARRMLMASGPGLKFSADIATRARPMIEAVFTQPPADRLLSVIRILTLLAADDNVKPLSSTVAVPTTGQGDRTRLDRVLDHIHLNYAAPLSVDALADIAALSPSGLHRLFGRHLHMTVSDYVTCLRIGEACALLSATEMPIAHIADEVGYASLANFNRQFKSLKAKTPREYRHSFARRS
ncbi:helix-turn-helix domain-containing protein [Rhizobium sp. Leaf453]|uniref:helix-turn-helix domain-containing protein n=1 Tax=Rhizobium sp. Leaf453 TaxID=1736380 RepID=UPI0007149744|nr:AraC family transcriptional regulator [Rhizobium sp. Leaf453]KQT92477.1 transcriptional regulator [Rhizobium sp. Leaf453]